MAGADASETRVAYIAEVTENTTPASPAFSILRVTGESLAYGKQTVVSNELRADRNVSDILDVGFTVNGGVNFELSYGTLDPLLESLFQSTWATNVLKNGVANKSFTFEKTFEQGATDAFLRYTGCQLNSLSLAIAAREIITGSFDVLGRDHSTGTAILSSATYGAVNDNEIMTGSSDVGALTLSGVTGTPKLRSINLNIANNLREQPVVGSKASAGTGAGRFVVTGSLEAYFEDLNLYGAFKDHTSVGMEITLGSVTTEKYTIEIPKLRLMNGVVNATGNDQDVMASFDFQGYFDSSEAATMVITRAVA